MEHIIFKNLPPTSNRFKLSEVYDRCLNITSKPSIRANLQKLRNKDIIIFHGKGEYSFTDKGLLEHILYTYSMDDKQMLREIFSNNS